MDPSSQTPIAQTDQLLLCHHVLTAMEMGRLPLHAADYQAYVIFAAEQLRRYSTGALVHARRTLPLALQCLAENILHDRRVGRWRETPNGSDDELARATWLALRRRLQRRRDS